MISNQEYPPCIINVKSSEREEGTISNFESKPILLQENNYDSCCMISTNIPRTFYNVDQGASFILKEDGMEHLIELDEGNYTITNLKIYIKKKLNAHSTNTYDMIYKTSTDVQDFKFTFTTTSTTQPQLIFTTSLYKVLGFNKNSINTFNNTVLKSTNCINLSRINSAYIKSNIVKNSPNSIFAEVLSYGSFQMLSMAYQTTQNIEMNSRMFIRQKSGSVSYRFSLVDENDTEINLNGVDYEFSLILYSRNKYFEQQQKELLITNLERQYKLQNTQQELRESTKDNTDSKILDSSNLETPGYYENKPIYNYAGPMDITNVNKEYL